MSYKIIVTPHFEKEIKRLTRKFPSLKYEFAELIARIIIKPDIGIYIGNNCYKIRIGIGSKGKGKSGGARVISYLYYEAEVIYLLTVYDKNEKSNIRQSELNEMIKSLKFDFD
jgi:mRNA-degrading endonuclease RelE of RelBE toxin-antitoxin system